MKFIFLLLIGFFGLFSANGSSIAAEKINIKFEEMLIPLTIEQLSKLEAYKSNSTDVLELFKKNGLLKILDLYKFLQFPVFKEEGLNRQILRSWVGRKILTELSNTILVPNDSEGIEVFNTIENLLEIKKEVSTLDILKALPSEEIILDIENLIFIISSWKKELAMQQNLILKLNELDTTEQNFFKEKVNKNDWDIIKVEKKIFTSHRAEPLKLEFWRRNKEFNDKELVIFMPGLGGDITNFRWIAMELSKRGWPVIVIDHIGSNSDAFTKILEGKDVIPGTADFFLYRIKDLEAVIKAHKNGAFQLANDSYILMGHSLGALIAFLYEGNLPKEGLENRCDLALKDFAITNLSKLMQCQLIEMPLPKINNPQKAEAIIGFNTFGSLFWPNENSSGINIPVLLVGGTYDLITPLISEQFKVFLSTTSNPLNRFLIIEGASHFSPINIDKKNEKGDFESNDIFKIKKPFIGSDPISVQNLSLKVIVEFLHKINKKDTLKIINNQKENNLEFHILNRRVLRELSKD